MKREVKLRRHFDKGLDIGERVLEGYRREQHEMRGTTDPAINATYSRLI